MDRIECYGHKLDLQRLDNDIVALCQCGKWRKVMPLSDESELKLLVARLTGAHYRHVDTLGRPSAVDAIGEGLPVLPDDLARPHPDAKSAVPALQSSLKDSHPEVRRGAAEALHQIEAEARRPGP